MTDINELVRLAEADGATIKQIPTGSWIAIDKDGTTVVLGALSQIEAARQYCEDRGLHEQTPAGILAHLRAQYAPYDTMPEFDEGMAARASGNWRSPYDDVANPGVGVKAQAWDRGLECASRYARALAAAERGAVVEQIRRPAPKPSLLAKLMHKEGEQ